MPLHRRVPKRGFTNIFRVEYDIVNLADLDRVRGRRGGDAGDARGARGSPARAGPVKILGDGEIKKALTVSAHKFSASREGQDRGGRRPLRGAVPLSALQSFVNIFNVPDLRKRVLFTFLVLAVYRLGAHIPTPGVDPAAINAFFKASAGLDLRLPRHLLGRRAAAALRLRPRDHAVHLGSIILQLLTVVWPYLEKLSKEGEMGRKKITQYTRYGTVLLSFIQATRHRPLAREAGRAGRRAARAASGLGASA